MIFKANKHLKKQWKDKKSPPPKKVNPKDYGQSDTTREVRQDMLESDKL